MDFSNIANSMNAAIRSNVELNNFDKNLSRELQSEQLEAIQSIAESAEAQAISAKEEVDILRKQLRLAREEAHSANIHSIYADAISAISIILALASLLADIL